VFFPKFYVYYCIPVIVIPSPWPLLASFTEKIPLDGTTASATSNSTWRVSKAPLSQPSAHSKSCVTSSALKPSNATDLWFTATIRSPT